MTYTIKIEIRFRSGHRLLPPYKGKCNNPHGEGYTAILEFEDYTLDENGMVMDFGDAKKFVKQWVDENWDHAYLYNKDDEVGVYLTQKGFRTFNMVDNPTAEFMAKYLYQVVKLHFPQLKKVGIIESFEDSIAYYEDENEN